MRRSMPLWLRATFRPGWHVAAWTVEPPRDVTHGDLATNAAMVLAKPAGANPRVLAEKIAAQLEKLDEVERVSVAGPGFINLTLTDDTWRAELSAIRDGGADYGRSTRGAGTTRQHRICLGQPDGSHAHGALPRRRCRRCAGEFAGIFGPRSDPRILCQRRGAGRSMCSRARCICGIARRSARRWKFPRACIRAIIWCRSVRALAAEFGDTYAEAPESEWLVLFRTKAVAAMLVLIKDDLALLGIHHDLFSSEAELQAAGKPEAAEHDLRARGLIYDGLLEAPKGQELDDWESVVLPLFRSTQFGDDQDRPIKKSNGQWTYFGADLAYHYQKAQTADALIDIWGADHAGTVKRIVAAVAALTGGKTRFDVKLVQMVRLMRNGEPIKMSKRAGNFVTLADVVREVGKDVVRFTMLTRKADAQMDFDFAKVVEASKDNPVFYVNYAHARVASLHRRAAEAGIGNGNGADSVDLSQLDTEDLTLVKLAAQFPRIVDTAAVAREPHRIAFYLYDLAAALHALWNVGNDRPARRFLLPDNPAMTGARLFLADAVGQIIRNGLGIMGVQAAEEMH